MTAGDADGASGGPPPQGFSLAELDQALTEQGPERKSASRKRWARIAKWTGLSLLGLGLLGALAVVLVIRHFEQNLPSVKDLKRGYHPPQVTRVLGREGASLAILFTERRTVVPFATIPDHVKLAFLAAEDASFYEHEGLDYFGMLRALFANLRAGKKRQGGSTITQQVIKNVLLEPERTYSRKIRETILARRLEQHLTKHEIFNLYLNHIYFGHRRYGIEEAARYYFGKKAAELDLAEAALLSGIVAAPEHFTPRRYPERALEKRAYVLDQMLEKGFVTPELHAYSKARPLRLAPEIEAESDIAPEVVGVVKKALEETVGKEAEQGGFVVTTTIDSELQALARGAVQTNLDRYLERHKIRPPFTLKQRALWGAAFQGAPAANHIYVGHVLTLDDKSGEIVLQVGDDLGRLNLREEPRYNPNKLLPTEFTAVGAALRVLVLDERDQDGKRHLRLELGPQSALVAIDVRSRDVVAMIGSYEALVGGLNRALQSKRQPGSSFKPFVYAHALESQRFTPASSFLVAVPKSRDKRSILLRQAVAESNNEVVLEVFRKVGAAGVVDFAHTLGIESEMRPTESLALGAYEVTPLELVNAYASLASGGDYVPARLISGMTRGDGRAIPLASAKTRRVISPEVAYLTTSLLASVVEHGTAKRARALGRPVAGKTGTTNRARDTWFVGYSTDLVAGVWVGYDDTLPLGPGESGAATALPAWVEFMKGAHAARPPTQFSRPRGIVVVRIDPATGLLPAVTMGETAALSIEEEFLDGTAPSETAPVEASPPDAGPPAASVAEGQEDAPRPSEGETSDPEARPVGRNGELDAEESAAGGAPSARGALPVELPEKVGSEDSPATP